MESSIAVFLLRQPACERLPTQTIATAQRLCDIEFEFGSNNKNHRSTVRAESATALKEESRLRVQFEMKNPTFPRRTCTRSPDHAWGHQLREGCKMQESAMERALAQAILLP